MEAQMRKPIFTEQQIIETAEALMSENGREPRPWEIYQSLGGRGKLARVESVWTAHREKLSVENVDVGVPVPDEMTEKLKTAVSSFEVEIQALIASLCSQHAARLNRRTEDFEAEIANLKACNSEEMKRLCEENAYLTAMIDEVQDRTIEPAGVDGPAPALDQVALAAGSPDQVPAKTHRPHSQGHQDSAPPSVSHLRKETAG